MQPPVRLAKAHVGWLQRLYRWIRNWIMYVFKGESELERICKHLIDVHRMIQFRTSIFLSASMEPMHEDLCALKAFPEDRMIKSIQNRESLSQGTKGLETCIACWNAVNKMLGSIVARSNEKYTRDNDEHEVR